MPIEMNGETYLTTDETLKILGVSRNTLDKMVKDGRLRKYKRGVTRTLYFRKADVERINSIQPIEDE